MLQPKVDKKNCLKYSQVKKAKDPKRISFKLLTITMIRKTILFKFIKTLKISFNFGNHHINNYKFKDHIFTKNQWYLVFDLFLV